MTKLGWRQFLHTKMIAEQPSLTQYERSNKSCLLDALPVWLIKENISILLPFIVSIVNSSLNAGLFPPTLKEAILMPLIKKPNLDLNVLTNYRPVSNLPFLSKIIEKAALEQLKNHLDAFDLHDEFQSAYRKHHGTETALLSSEAKELRSSRH